MKQIVLATGNPHKKAEFQDMLPRHEILTLPDLDRSIEIVEDGETFEDNALAKARAVHQATGLAVMADDSGLEVDGLDGFPGIRSARWMGEDTAYAIKNARLLELIQGRDRTARYVCAIAYIDESGRETVVRGTVEGCLAEAPSGSHGFGYDPIFYYPPFGKTLGDTPEEKKHEISHRGRALRRLLELHPELL